MFKVWEPAIYKLISLHESIRQTKPYGMLLALWIDVANY